MYYHFDLEIVPKSKLADGYQLSSVEGQLAYYMQNWTISFDVKLLWSSMWRS